MIQRHHSTNHIQQRQPTPNTTTTNEPQHNTHTHSRPLSRANSCDSTSAHSPKQDQHQAVPTTPTPSSTSLAGSVTTKTLFDPLPHLPSRLRQATLKLVPPPNFGFIEEALFRSGEPAELSLAFIHRLNLHSLLWLAPQPPSSKFQEFLAGNSIQFHNLGIQHAASLDAVTEEAVTHALELILNPTIYPLMIMCGGGSHRTGTVVGCLRKLQGWNLASIFEEYRRYAGAQHHFMNEQFIEFYNINRLVNDLTSEEASEGENTYEGRAVGGREKREADGLGSGPAISLPPPLMQPSPTFSLAVHQIDPLSPLADTPTPEIEQSTPPKFKRAAPSSSLSF